MKFKQSVVDHISRADHGEKGVYLQSYLMRPFEEIAQFSVTWMFYCMPLLRNYYHSVILSVGLQSLSLRWVVPLVDHDIGKWGP